MPIVLVTFLILGAVGLFLALPGGRALLSRVGLVVLAGAAGTLLAALAKVALGGPEFGWLAVCALVSLFAAVRVITHTKPVYSALYFVLLVVAVTALLVLLDATFLAAALVLVYAGAILVTYVFVIMLAQQGTTAPYDAKSRDPFLGCLAGFALLAAVIGQVYAPGAADPHVPLAAASDNVAAVGTRLLTQYVIAIQIAGVLLLAAMVGAIAVARRRVTGTDALDTEVQD